MAIPARSELPHMPLSSSAMETVNEDPEGKGWFCKLTLSDKGELEGLMDAAAYKTFCEGL